MSILLTVLVFSNAVGFSYNYQNSYKAAVVDYVHRFPNNTGGMQNANAREFMEIMRNVSREYADIVVFPEYGLVDIGLIYEVIQENPKYLYNYSTLVPEPVHQIAPCDYKHTQIFAKYLVNISCTARLHGLYTVINVIERRYNNKTPEYYNTDVVFDRLGVVIAKYSKINLSEEPFLTAGTELVTFQTDFNVTFGIFTCFDILFKNPALNILETPEVTDIIFPTAWYSQTPFLQALSIEHGYAKTNGVNMLAACLQAPLRQDSGSGIYLADGTIAQYHVSANLQTKILIYDVPIVKHRIPATMCSTSKSTTDTHTENKNYWKHNEEGQSFPTTTEDMTGYVYKPLSNGLETQTIVCSEDKVFCCHFTILMESNSKTIKTDNTYRLAAFNGNRNFGSKILGGVRACVVLGCLNDSDSTCGNRINKTISTVTFKSIQIKTTVNSSKDTYFQSATLKYDLSLVSEYTYCEEFINFDKHVKIAMATTAPQTDLLSFGIFGRVYSADKISIEPTLPPSAEPLNITLIVAILFCTFIGLICLGVIIRLRTRKN